MKSHPPADGAGAPSAELHIDSIEDDRWTWRYVEPGSGVELHSNETYASRERAADVARRAYPDVPLADDDDPQTAEAPDDKHAG